MYNAWNCAGCQPKIMGHIACIFVSNAAYTLDRILRSCHVTICGISTSQVCGRSIESESFGTVYPSSLEGPIGTFEVVIPRASVSWRNDIIPLLSGCARNNPRTYHPGSIWIRAWLQITVSVVSRGTYRHQNYVLLEEDPACRHFCAGVFVSHLVFLTPALLDAETVPENGDI